MQTSREIEPTTPPVAFIFDVDGVITDPKEKRITQENILGAISEKLEKGSPIALNTGRSNDWMIERVILPLKGKAKHGSLSNFFAVGEKGLTWAAFNENGELVQGIFDRQGRRIEGFDLSAFLDETTVQHFQRIVPEVKALTEGKYSHSTFFDSTKKAMISTEMHDGYNHEDFEAEQSEFVQHLKKLLEKERLSDRLRIDPTTIATDIQIPEAGKHLGAKRILEWLKSRNINPAHFITLGDSSSDLEMADEIHEQDKSVDFWYVNPDKPLQVEKPYNVKVSKRAFSEGTLELLSI